MAKVVLVDNYDRDYVADKLLRDNLTEEQAIAVAKEYNDKYPDDHSWFAVVRDDLYELKIYDYGF